jgi:hypothetical protein
MVQASSQLFQNSDCWVTACLDPRGKPVLALHTYSYMHASVLSHGSTTIRSLPILQSPSPQPAATVPGNLLCL